jgi:hypothetical protein
MNECKPLFPELLSMVAADASVYGLGLKRRALAVLHSCLLTLGGTVQIDPIKPVLKAPGSMLLKLRYDRPLPKIAFKFNLRRYNWG